MNGLRQRLTGARMLLAVPLLPMIVAGGEAAAGWPMCLALNAGLGAAATPARALFTLGLSLMTVSLVSRTACAQVIPRAATS